MPRLSRCALHRQTYLAMRDNQAQLQYRFALLRVAFTIQISRPRRHGREARFASYLHAEAAQSRRERSPVTQADSFTSTSLLGTASLLPMSGVARCAAVPDVTGHSHSPRRCSKSSAHRRISGWPKSPAACCVTAGAGRAWHLVSCHPMLPHQRAHNLRTEVANLIANHIRYCLVQSSRRSETGNLQLVYTLSAGI